MTCYNYKGASVVDYFSSSLGQMTCCNYKGASVVDYFSSVQFYLTFTSYITNLQKLFTQIQLTILVKIDLMKTE